MSAEISNIKLNSYEVKKILTFISSMKKTGKNVIKSLEFYGEKIAKDQKIKNAISSTVAEVSSGGKLEETLLKYGFLNSFQYTILKVSNDKNKAYDNILKFDKNKSEATLFYGKKLMFSTIIYVAIFFLLPMANDFFSDILERITETKKDYVMGGYVAFVLGFNDYYRPLSFVILGLAIGLVFFYNYSYANNLPLHYKIFRYRAMVDTKQFFEIMVDLLKSELTVSKSLNLLGQYAEPKSARYHIKKIQEAIEFKNSPELEKQLKDFSVNDFATFTLLSGLEVGELKNAFTNAYQNTVDYNEVEEAKHKETIDVIGFFLNTLLVGATVMYFVLLESEIAFS